MSMNLIVAVEQEDHGNIVRPMILPRIMAGLTHSAVLSIGHTIDVEGLHVEVINITHQYQNGDKAPVSIVHGKFHRPLGDNEIDAIRIAGFKDME